MSLEQLQHELLALAPEDRVDAIRLLTASLSGSWGRIRKQPSSDGDAFVSETGIAVWFLVHRRGQGITEAALLAEYPDLTATDLANAWLYAQLNKEEIHAAIQRHLTDEQPDIDDDSKEDIIDSLKQSWREAKAGNTIPLSQMWEGIDV
ncbi:MAG: DUF433 domain-containing protein [Cyanobacteria bacterium J06628_6]